MSGISLVLERMPRVLLWATVGHVVVSVGALLALGLAAAPILGVHPALKPLKFGVSIALFLATMGVVLPSLSAPAAARTALAWLFAATMVAEMAPILAQALRGTPSHFNMQSAADSALWRLMLLAILVATAGMLGVAVLATVRPLQAGADQAMPPLLAFAWRAGVWLLLLAPVSGFAMGGRGQHSVGGADGGAGLPLVNWSVLHGDLRVSHFFALHALQVLPLLAWLLLRVRAAAWARWAMVLTAAAVTTALCLGTLAQAFRGRPFLHRADGADGASAPAPRAP